MNVRKYLKRKTIKRIRRISNYANVSGIGNYELKENSTRIDIKVTSPNGDEKTYTLNITREENTQTCDIKSLTIEDYNLSFKSEIYNYKLNV